MMAVPLVRAIGCAMRHHHAEQGVHDEHDIVIVIVIGGHGRWDD